MSTVKAERYRSLDGLRGVAALIVLLHHSLLSTQLVDSYFTSARLEAFSGSWWLLETPFGLFFAGTPAVLLFFTLSGFVLAGPALRGGFDWVSFSARRIVRIWIPVAASLILSATLILLFPQYPYPGASAWLNQFTFAAIDFKQWVANFDLLFGPSQYNNPLWSMHFELLFSLSLAAFILVVVPVVRIGIRVAVLALTLIAACGALLGMQQLVFIPGFAVGVALAVHVARSGYRAYRPSIEALLFAAGLLLLFIYAFTRLPLGVGQFTKGFEWMQALWIPGAILLLRAALTCAWFRRVLEIRPLQWLGRTSFSLYLIHVPVLVAIQHQAGHGLELKALFLAIPVAFVGAQLFWRFVDRPSIELARKAGRFVSTEMASFRGDSVRRLLGSQTRHES